jgi:hypothetical protein
MCVCKAIFFTLEIRQVWVSVQHFGINIFHIRISLFHVAFQFTIYKGPTNALVCNETLIQMSHTKTLKITPTCFDHQTIIIKELFDPG